MAMLAERKQKQKWSLNPRGKYWSDDSNKFGQKLMEKMGWKAGKGLGAKLDGMTEHVKVSHKHDNKGMGYKENGEQWTQHEENFSKLLQSLGENSEVVSVPQKSLEEISANSKKRVHYHKFTRGKDLTQYSEKQLANIFGKKSLKPQKSEEIDETSLENANKKYGVDTVEGGSMVDYFKNKLGGRFKSTAVVINGGFEVGNDGVLRKVEEINNRGESESDLELERPSFGFGFSSGSCEEIKIAENSGDDGKVAKKSKKRKIGKDEAAYDNIVSLNDSLENVEVKQKKKKCKTDLPPEIFEVIKKKKSKKCDVNSTVDIINISEEKNIKKKKKRKSNKVTPILEEDIINHVETAIKNKNPQNNENVLNGNVSLDESNIIKQTPSKKKSKSDTAMETSIAEEVVRKKSKKLGVENPNFDLSDMNISAGDLSNEFEVKRKKKKDKVKKSRGLDNPALNMSNLTDESYQEGLSTSMQQNLFQGIENLGLNVTASDSIGDCNSDVIECELMLNVTGLPHSAGKKELEKRKSVRFSDRLNEEYIIPNNFQNKLMAQKVEGLANAAFDERALTLQENLLDIEQHLSTDCAKVENDLNEVRAAAHARLLVPIVPSDNNTANICHGNAGVKSLPARQGGGKINKKSTDTVVHKEVEEEFPEVGEPDLLEANQVTPNGDVRLAYKLATLKVPTVPHYIRKLPKNSDRASYKHLIKGDIILGFKNCNLDKIDGYASVAKKI